MISVINLKIHWTKQN